MVSAVGSNKGWTSRKCGGILPFVVCHSGGQVVTWNEFRIALHRTKYIQYLKETEKTTLGTAQHKTSRLAKLPAPTLLKHTAKYEQSFSTSGGPTIVTPQNAAVLMIDHQAGLCQLVRDYPVDIFKQNVLALADTAKLFKMKTILTTSFEAGPNGPLMPEVKEAFADAPYIARPGQNNAWDNEDFVKAVKDTGCKKLILAGIVTDVCVVFPALAALAEGYEVYIVVDACGTFNEAVRNAALQRLSSAGAVLINWFALACELQRDWRNDGEAMAKLCSKHLPDYGNLFASYNYATAAATNAVLGK